MPNMMNTLDLGRVNWKNVSDNSSVEEIDEAIKQTRDVYLANRVSLSWFQIEVPYQNTIRYLNRLKAQATR